MSMNPVKSKTNLPAIANSNLLAELEEYRIVKEMSGGNKDFILAYSLMKSGAFPDTNSIAEALTKIEAGKAHGFDAATALNAFDIIETKEKNEDGSIKRIKKTLSMRSAAIAAKFERSKIYKKHIIIHDRHVCKILIYRKAEDGQWKKISNEPVVYTIEDAKAANLTGKFNWRAYPELMLYYRCISKAAKLYAPDLLHSVKTVDDVIAAGEEVVHCADDEDIINVENGNYTEIDPNEGHNVKVEYILDQVPQYGYDYQAITVLAKNAYKVDSINDLTDDQRLALVQTAMRNPLNKKELINKGKEAEAVL